MGLPGMPLRRTREEEVHKRAVIQFRKVLGNPLCWRMSMIYSHHTESKAFLISSLKRRDGVLLL